MFFTGKWGEGGGRGSKGGGGGRGLAMDTLAVNVCLYNSGYYIALNKQPKIFFR